MQPINFNIEYTVDCIRHTFSNGLLFSCNVFCVDMLYVVAHNCVVTATFIPDVSEKKYGVADYQYFMNGNTQQYHIFRHDKYNFHLVVCEVSTPS